MDCGQFDLVWGKDEKTVEKDVAKIVCTTEKQCKEDGVPRTCVRRSAVHRSKEDPDFFLGLVWCVCPGELKEPTGDPPGEVQTVKCHDQVSVHGVTSQEVESYLKKYECTKEKQCKEGGKEVNCVKRSMIAPSKEDPKFWMGVVWCACPVQLLEKKRTGARSD